MKKNQTVHQGLNIKRIRQFLGVKQELLAYQMGKGWNQQRISMIEQKEKIDDSFLQEISSALKVPIEALLTLDDDKARESLCEIFTFSKI